MAGPDAAFALAMQSIGSAVVLNVLLWLGLVVSIPLRGFNPLYVTAAILGLVVVGGFSAAVVSLTRGEERAVRVLRAVARRVPLLDEERIPITPGGLGVVEAVLTATLVGFGAPRGVAILGVISYRLVNFWLPIPLGAAAYLSLRLRPGTRRADELRRLAEEAAPEAEDLKTWAARHGVKLAGKPTPQP